MPLQNSFMERELPEVGSKQGSRVHSFSLDLHSNMQGSQRRRHRRANKPGQPRLLCTGTCIKFLHCHSSILAITLPLLCRDCQSQHSTATTLLHAHYHDRAHMPLRCPPFSEHVAHATGLPTYFLNGKKNKQKNKKKEQEQVTQHREECTS